MPEQRDSESALLILVLDGVYRQPCARRVARSLEKVPGVRSAAIHLPTRAAFINYNPAQTDLSSIRLAIETSGYGILAQTDKNYTDPSLALLAVKRELARYRLRTAVSMILWAAFVFTDFFQFSHYTLWLLATALVFWCSAHFHKGALRALRTLSPDINLLVSLPALLIYLQGTSVAAERYLSLEHEHAVFWPQLAALVALTNLGRLMEKQAMAGQAKTLYNLLSAFPKLARKLNGDKEQVCDAASVRAGDSLSVRAGEQIPTDGTVLEGVSSVDESFVSDLPGPARKIPGDRVWGGTHNKSGRLVIRSESAPGAMMFARSISAVWRKQAERIYPRSASDTAAMAALPLILAMAAFFSYPEYTAQPYWLDGLLNALERVSAFLAAGTPATLALAAPLALLFAHDRGDHEGFLLQNPAAMESASVVNSLTAEHSGFLTQDKLTVTEIFCARGDEKTLLRQAMTALQDTGLPCALAVAAAAKSRKIAYPQADSTEYFPGRGVRARYGTDTVLAGSMRWLKEQGVPIETEAEDKRSAAVAIASGGVFLGYLRLADQLRPSAKESMRLARENGLEPVLISGSSEGCVTACALEFGIARCYHDTLPERKAEAVEDLKKSGLRPAVLGMGLPDALAMASGQLGISGAANAPLEPLYADIALRAPDFGAAVRAVLLLRKAQAALRRNLLIALLFCVPLALQTSGLTPWKTGPAQTARIFLAANLIAVAALTLNSYLLRRTKI